MSAHGGPSDDVVYFDENVRKVEIRGEQVPKQVINVVKGLPEGDGRYLDDNGAMVDPF